MCDASGNQQSSKQACSVVTQHIVMDSLYFVPSWEKHFPPLNQILLAPPRFQLPLPPPPGEQTNMKFLCETALGLLFVFAMSVKADVLGCATPCLSQSPWPRVQCVDDCVNHFGCMSAESVLKPCEPQQIFWENVLKQFAHFADKYRRNYSSVSEVLNRMNVFAKSYTSVLQHTAFLDWKLSTYQLALNAKADRFPHEIFTFLPFPEESNGCSELPQDTLTMWKRRHAALNSSQSLDWRESGALNPPKDQKQCGSCWAFAAVAVIESASFLATGILPSLSEQELVSCAGNFDENGCQGGNVEGAFYFVKAQGLCSETEYPYQGIDDSCELRQKQDYCPGWTKQAPVYIVSCFGVPVLDEHALLASISNHGPIAIAIAAASSHFMLYHMGIFTACSPRQLDHAVVVVGFGISAATNMKYWIVRNSWGADWGESGYIRLLRSTSDVKVEGCLGMLTTRPLLPVSGV